MNYATQPNNPDQPDNDQPMRMPYPVKVAAFLLAALAVVAGLGAVGNAVGYNNRTHAVVFLGSIALSAVVAAVGLIRARRWGSYLAFGLALLLALASLRNIGVAVAGIGFLAAIMGTLMTRSAKDWFGFV